MMEDEKKQPVCRICLNKIERTAKCFYLFQHYEEFPGCNHDNITIAEKITALSKVAIKEGDGLPNEICSKCVLELETAYEFKRKCEKSDDILRLATVYDNKYREVPASETSESYEHDYLENEGHPSMDLLYNDVKPDPEDISIDIKNEEYIDLTDKAVPKLDEQYQRCEDNVIKKSKAIDLKLECDRCNKTFKSKCKMRVHWKREHNKFICPSCNLVFRTLKAYHNHQMKRSKFCINAHKMHIEGKGKARIIFCKECNYKSNSKLSMLTHLSVHTKEKSFICDLCHKNFSQYTSLKRHKEFTHKLFLETKKTCHACGEIIIGQYKFIEHMSKKHGKKKTCSICKKEISSRSLQNHMKIHSGIRSYTCEICSETFVTITQLCNHKTYRHKQKECYTCNICGYKIKNRYKLRKHEKTHNEGNVACNICGFFMQDDAELDSHMKRHLVKPHKCEYCSKSFCLRKTLTQHYRDAHKIFVSKEHNSKLSGIVKRVSTSIIKLNIKCRSDVSDTSRSSE